MRPRWQAPRTAYLMTAMTAEHDCNGPSRLFWGLGDAGQLDVLRALGAQCRAAISSACGPGWRLDPGRLERMREAFEHPARVFQAIVQGLPWEMPELPACACCRLITASFLCGTAVDAGRQAGLSRELIAHHCREAAAL